MKVTTGQLAKVFIVMSFFALAPIGADAQNFINGTVRGETIRGTGAIDSIDGRAGRDTLYGGESGDFLYSGTKRHTFCCSASGPNNASTKYPTETLLVSNAACDVILAL